MKIVKIFGGVLMVGTFIHAGGDFQVVTEYESNDEVLAEKAYLSSYIDEPEFIEPEQSYVTVVEKEDEDIYSEPTVESYMDSSMVEEEPIYVTSSSNLGNAVNIYNASEHIQTMNSSESVTQESTGTKTSQINTLSTVKNGFYAGLGITALNYDIKCDCPDKSSNGTALGVMTKVGYNINRFIGVEARGMNVKLKDNMGKVKHAGLFLKPMLPLGSVANVYSLVGVAQTKTTGKIREVDTTSLALGAGMEFGTGKGLGAFVDYERLIVKSGSPKLDTVSTGVSFGF